MSQYVKGVLGYADALQDSRRYSGGLTLNDLTSGGTSYAGNPIQNLLNPDINKTFRRTFSAGGSNDIRISLSFTETNSLGHPGIGMLGLVNMRTDLASARGKLIRPPVRVEVTVSITGLGTILSSVPYLVPCGGASPGLLAVAMPFFDDLLLPTLPYAYHARGGTLPGTKTWTIEFRVKNTAGLGDLDFTCGRVVAMSVFPFKMGNGGLQYGYNDPSNVQWSYGRVPYANRRTPQRFVNFNMVDLHDAQVHGGWYDPVSGETASDVLYEYVSNFNSINTLSGLHEPVLFVPKYVKGASGSTDGNSYAHIAGQQIYGLMQNTLVATQVDRRAASMGGMLMETDGVWAAPGSVWETPGTP